MAQHVAGARGIGVRAIAWSAAAGLLLVPLVAMRFTDEVRWTAGDFAAMGALLLAAGGAVELFVAAGRDPAYRIGGALTVLAALALVWINLAVGIIGDEANGANLLFVAVLAVLVVGSAAVRLRGGGMAGVLVVTALAQGAVAVSASAAGWGSIWPITGLFAALWLAAAGAFARAAWR